MGLGVFDSEAVFVRDNGGEAEAKEHPCSAMDAKPCRRLSNRRMSPRDPPSAPPQAIFSFVIIICILNPFLFSRFSLVYGLKLTSVTFYLIFIINKTPLETSESSVGCVIVSTGLYYICELYRQELKFWLLFYAPYGLRFR